MTTRQAWNASWNVNTVGTHIMTSTFVPLLLKSHDPRLLFMASGTSALTGTENPALPINKIPNAGWPKTDLAANANLPAYRSSKCGMNMMMRGAWNSKRGPLLFPALGYLLSFFFFLLIWICQNGIACSSKTASRSFASRPASSPRDSAATRKRIRISTRAIRRLRARL